MRNGKCSKCGSATVVSQPYGIGPKEGVCLQVGVLFQQVDTMSFLCTTCGYYEIYITDAKKLSAAAQQWPKVPVT